MRSRQPAGKRILVVEDDMATRDALSLILEDEGYEVTGAANGQEALLHLRQGTVPDLILLDLMMPVMDGWQFRKEQNRDPVFSKIPVVVLSADGNVQQKATSIGAIGYLQKPVEVENLLAAIQRYCG